MGIIYTRLTRPLRSFNIENRTDRVFSRKKPIPAPQYASVERQKQMVDKLNPNFLEDQHKKDLKLHDRLKKVYVASEDSKDKPAEGITSSRSLPQNRSRPASSYYDYYDESMAVSGKCSLKQAIRIITNYQQDPVNYSVEKISQEYHLDKQLVENIVKNFKIFHSVQKELQLEEKGNE